MELGKAEDIAQSLRQKIISGEIASDTKLSAERDIAAEYNASRETVRRSLEILEREGLVTRYPGRGAYVSGVRERILVDKGREITNTVDASELRLSGSFIKDMERLGKKPHVQFLEQPSLVASTTEIAEQLQVEQGTLVFKRYRLQLADNLPYRIIESYYPSDLFSELLTTNIGDKPLFQWLQERHNVKVTHAKENLISRLATPKERQLLKISSSSPVVAINRTVYSVDRPVEFAHIIAVAALYVFSYEYSISDWNVEKKP